MEAPLISDLEEKTEMIFSSKEEFPDLTHIIRVSGQLSVAKRTSLGRRLPTA
jgi:hypothetical protein